MRALVLWFESLLRRSRVEADMEREIRHHIQMETEANVRRGMSRDDAHRAALIAFGGVDRAKEDVRDERNTRWLESVAADCRHALRTLLGQRAFSAAVIGTLALGIAAVTTIFSMVHAVILRPLPYPDPERIVSLSVSNQGSDMGVSDDWSYDAWSGAPRSVVAMAAHQSLNAVIQTAAGPREVRGRQATAGYFTVMGVQPLAGRVFTAEEARRGGPRVVLLSEQLWRDTFGAESPAPGRSIMLDGEAHSIIGVMPDSFTTPRGAQFWLPFRLGQVQPATTWYFPVAARLRADATLDGLRAELEAIQARIEPSRPERSRGLRPVVMTLHERRFGDTRRPLLLLFAAVGVLLLITCANVANLSLARSTRRRQEFALRLALGASRMRLAQYVLVESFVLSLAGAVLGAFVASVSLGYFVRISPGSVANVDGIRLDGIVLAFTLLIAAITTLLFGIVPAAGAARSNLRDSLAAASARAAGSRPHALLRRALVVAELATALVLVVGAGLVARTFWMVTSVPMGFEPRNVLTARISLPRNRYTDSTARRFMEEVLGRARQAPRVDDAALVDALPLTGARMTKISREGIDGPRFNVVGATDRYFETIGARLISGRFLTERDGRAGSEAVVLSDALARRTFGAENAVGKRFDMGDEELLVVGVVDDVRQRGLEGEVAPTAFVPLAQAGGWMYLQLVMKTSGPITPLTRLVIQTVQAIDPALPPPEFRTMDEIVDGVVSARKFLFVLLGLFAALAGLLAAVGLYGVLAYIVAERTKEIGIRVALGADRGRVRRLILREGMALALLGIVLGVALAFPAVQLVEKMLYQVSAHDAATFAASIILLLVAAATASFVPAWKAARVDPMLALRHE